MGDIRDPREFFSQHHQAYVTSAHHARGRDLEILIAGLNPKAGHKALDVATGAGHTALQLARAGADVTISDITPAMLDDALHLACQQGHTLTPVESYAESLPFSDATFHIVTCRRAAHHFREIPAFLGEAHRVLTPGGRLGISDMTSSVDGEDWLNQLERRRDPSHHRAWAVDTWYASLVRAGFKQIEVQLLEELLSFEQWLAPVSPDSEEGVRARAFFDADPPIEFVRDHGFVKRRIVLWADR